MASDGSIKKKNKKRCSDLWYIARISYCYAARCRNAEIFEAFTKGAKSDEVAQHALNRPDRLSLILDPADPVWHS